MPRTPSANSTSRLVPRSRIFQRDHGNDVHAPSTPHRFLLRLSRNLDTLGFARVNKNEGCKGGNGEGSEIRGELGPMTREERVQKSSTIFVFTVRLRTVVCPPSLHPSMEKTKGVPCWVSTFCHNPGLLASCFRGAEGRRRRIFFSIVKTNFP